MNPRKIAILSAGLLLSAVFITGCSGKSSGVFQGYIEGEYVYVASPLGGTLTNLAVARGDRGQGRATVVRIWNGIPKPPSLNEAEKNLAQADANLALSEAEFARRKQLREDQLEVISAEELDQARAQRDADEAQVESQQAARGQGALVIRPKTTICAHKRIRP